MSDFERSGDRTGATYDEPAKRRSPGTFFADLGDRLARGFSSFDRPQQKEPEWEPDEADWEPYEEEFDQPTEAVDPLPPAEPSRKRFPTALHGYDRDAVEDYIDGLEQELGQMAAKLSAQRQPTSTIEAELTRVGEETSAILRVAHEQAAEITKRARVEADRCIADAAANAVKMTEDAKRNLRELDSETDAVWAERVRLVDDVRNVATSLFSLAEDATDRFPEEHGKGSPTISVSAMRSEPKAAPVPETNAAPAPEPNTPPPPAQKPAPPPGTPPPATAAAAAPPPVGPPSPVTARPPDGPGSPIASRNHSGGGGSSDGLAR